MQLEDIPLNSKGDLSALPGLLPEFDLLHEQGNGGDNFCTGFDLSRVVARPLPQNTHTDFDLYMRSANAQRYKDESDIPFPQGRTKRPPKPCRQPQPPLPDVPI